ncbi:MAG: GNAT family N-acetyltransferase [Pseudomonadota bacterium]
MTGANCNFEFPSPQIAPALTEFAHRCFVDTYAHQNTADNIAAYVAEHFRTTVFADLLRSRAHVVITMYVNNELAGYAIGQRVAAASNGGDELDIERFYIDKRYHGGGYAARLMAALDRSAAALGIGRMRLGVYSDNPRAIAFYRQQGFEIVGEQTFMFGSEAQRDWVMAKQRYSDDFSDAEFVDAFLRADWPPAAWTHTAHVRLAWALLGTNSPEDAIETVRSGIRRYNARVLDSDGYHETMTRAFFRLVEAEFQSGEDFAAFQARASDLFSRSPLAVERYYSPALLASDLAKRQFVEPDCQPLPAVH